MNQSLNNRNDQKLPFGTDGIIISKNDHVFKNPLSAFAEQGTSRRSTWCLDACGRSTYDNTTNKKHHG